MEGVGQTASSKRVPNLVYYSILQYIIIYYGILGLYWGVLLGLYWDNGKYNGNYDPIITV